MAAGEKKLAREPHPVEMFKELVQSRTAGSPMNEKQRWTNLKDTAIVRIFQAQGVAVSRHIVRQLAALEGFVKRAMKKTKTAREVAGRDEQFEKSNALREDFLKRGLPVLSIDTKKKEFIGQFYRAGKSYCEKAVEVLDHDFPSLASGRVVPHGIYDVNFNKGYLSIGNSKDTAEFMCDNLKYHWQNKISENYRQADEMLLLMDGGGSKRVPALHCQRGFAKLSRRAANKHQSRALSGVLLQV